MPTQDISVECIHLPPFGKEICHSVAEADDDRFGVLNPNRPSANRCLTIRSSCKMSTGTRVYFFLSLNIFPFLIALCNLFRCYHQTELLRTHKRNEKFIRRERSQEGTLCTSYLRTLSSLMLVKCRDDTWFGGIQLLSNTAAAISNKPHGTIKCWIFCHDCMAIDSFSARAQA